MAITYTKGLKTIAVKTLGGTEVTATDTAEKSIASNALAEFEAFQTMHIPGEEGTTLIPFHAVDSIVVTVSAEEVTRADAYCEEETDKEPSEPSEP